MEHHYRLPLTHGRPPPPSALPYHPPSSPLSPAPTFLSLGDCEPEYSTLPSYLRASAFELSWLLGALHLHNWGLSLHRCMYRALHEHLSNASRAQLPSVVIADFASPVALDIADAFDLPVVLNNCNSLNFLPPTLLQPLPYLPLVSSGTPLSALRWPSIHLQLQRFVLPPRRPPQLAGLAAARPAPPQRPPQRRRPSPHHHRGPATRPSAVGQQRVGGGVRAAHLSPHSPRRTSPRPRHQPRAAPGRAERGGGAVAVIGPLLHLRRIRHHRPPLIVAAVRPLPRPLLPQ